MASLSKRGSLRSASMLSRTDAGRDSSSDDEHPSSSSAHNDGDPDHPASAFPVLVSSPGSRRGSASLNPNGRAAARRMSASGLSSLALRTASTPAVTRSAAVLAMEDRAEHREQQVRMQAQREAEEAAWARMKEEKEARLRQKQAQQKRVLTFAEGGSIGGPGSAESADSSEHEQGSASDSAGAVVQRSDDPALDPSQPTWQETQTSSRWAASHNHLLQNLSTLRDEIAHWEEEAVARMAAAEAELAAWKSSEEFKASERAQRVQEAEQSRLFFFNSFASRRASNIRQGGDGETPMQEVRDDKGNVIETVPAPGRRATWNATEAAARVASVLGLPSSKQSPEAPAALTAEAKAAQLHAAAEATAALLARYHHRESDVRALRDLARVMNTDKDEEWMQALLDFGRSSTSTSTATSAATGSNSLNAPSPDPAFSCASPSRRTNGPAGKPVSKVYSSLAREHRRALRRHPKIIKWLKKIWRVFFTRGSGSGSGSESGTGGKVGGDGSGKEEKEREESKSSLAPAPSGSDPAVAPSPSPSPSPTAASITLVESDGLTKFAFLSFYHLLHLVISGDDADLAGSATHDWERVVGVRPRMGMEEFCNILFEIVDLWCLTHIPEDYVSILKALYCRMTVRSPDPNGPEGTMRTSFIDARAVGMQAFHRVAPILGAPNAAEEARRAARRAKRKQLEKMIQQQQKEEHRRARLEAMELEAKTGKGPAPVGRRGATAATGVSFADQEEDGWEDSPPSSANESENSDSELQSDEEDESNRARRAAPAAAGGTKPPAPRPSPVIAPTSAPASAPALASPSLPLADENGRLLSLNAPQLLHAQNRLRSRETQYVNEAVLALNEAVCAMHDQSYLILKVADMREKEKEAAEAAEAAAADDGGDVVLDPSLALAPSGTVFSSVYSGSGLGYAARRKTIGLKWSIVSELMESEIERAKKERERIERMQRQAKRSVLAPVAVPATPSTPNDASSPSSSNATPTLGRDASHSTLDSLMVLGIGAGHRRPHSRGGSNLSLSVPPGTTLAMLSPTRGTGRSGSRGGSGDGPFIDVRSPSPSPMPVSPGFIYSAFDEGDSDLEDEEDARRARQARKARVGHSWPSLARVLALARRARNIEGSWMSVVTSSLARKRRAEEIAAQARLLRHFKRTRLQAERHARIAGITLKPNLELEDLPMLEELARLNFVRGGDKQAEKISAMLEERERDRAALAKEREKEQKELERKRAEHVAAARHAARVRAAREKGEEPPPPPAAAPETAASGAHPASSTTAAARAERRASLKSRRISWKEEGGKGNAILAHAHASAQSAAAAPPVPAPVKPARAASSPDASDDPSRVAAAATSTTTATAPVTASTAPATVATSTTAPASTSASTSASSTASISSAATNVRAQRKAAQDATMSRLAGPVSALPGAGTRHQPVCRNPAHDHSSRAIKMGITVYGNRYPLEDANFEGPCVFSPTMPVTHLAGGQRPYPMHALPQQFQSRRDAALALQAAQAHLDDLSPRSPLSAGSPTDAHHSPFTAPSPSLAPFSIKGGHMPIVARERDEKATAAATASRVSSAPRRAGLTGAAALSVHGGAAGSGTARSRDDAHPPHSGPVAGGHVGPSSVGMAVGARLDHGSMAPASRTKAEGRSVPVHPSQPQPLRNGSVSARGTSPAGGRTLAISAPDSGRHGRSRASTVAEHAGPISPSSGRHRSYSAVSRYTVGEAAAAAAAAADPARVIFPSVGVSTASHRPRLPYLSASASNSRTNSRTGSPTRGGAVLYGSHAKSLAPSHHGVGSAAAFLAAHQHSAPTHDSTHMHSAYPHMLGVKHPHAAAAAAAGGVSSSVGSSPVMRGAPLAGLARSRPSSGSTHGAHKDGDLSFWDPFAQR